MHCRVIPYHPLFLFLLPSPPPTDPKLISWVFFEVKTYSGNCSVVKPLLSITVFYFSYLKGMYFQINFIITVFWYFFLQQLTYNHWVHMICRLGKGRGSTAKEPKYFLGPDHLEVDPSSAPYLLCGPGKIIAPLCSQLPCLWNGENNDTFLTGLLWSSDRISAWNFVWHPGTLNRKSS
jgi:hypothetical protein